MGIAEISSKSNEDLDYDRECSVPPIPGDIAEISSNSWSCQKDYWPQIQIESARLSPCGVDIDVGFFPTVLGVGLNPTPMDVGLSPMFFPTVLGVGLNPTPCHHRIQRKTYGVPKWPIDLGSL